jgi:hypothetical protein
VSHNLLLNDYYDHLNWSYSNDIKNLQLDNVEGDNHIPSIMQHNEVYGKEMNLHSR